MKADTLDLNAVFGRDVRYIVPLFQRPYVWNMSQHWEPLWNDVRSVAEQIESLNQRVDFSANFHVPPHFLGALVVEQVATAVGQIDARQVIDGQQRLTTLQLLIVAARRVAASLKQERHERLLGRLVDNNPDLVREPDHAFKVWPTNADRSVFRAVVRGTPLTDVDSDASLKIANAKTYFETAIAAWLEDLAETALENRFEALTTAIRTHVRVVVIDLDDDDNAQIIFETLNARGTPLQAADLVKNVVFQRALTEGAKPEELYARHWAPFDTEVWRSEVRQGRLLRPRLDVFIGHWLTMKTGTEVLSHQLFPVFKSHLNAEGQSASSTMEDLARSAHTYESFDRFPWDSIEGRFFARQQLLDVTTTIPFLLFLFDIDKDTLPAERRASVLLAIESYLIRRTLCRQTTKNYNRIFLEMLSRVKDDPAHADTVAINYFSGLAGETQYWPPDNEVQEAVLNTPVYTSLPRTRVRLVLEAIEWAMRTELGEKVQLFDTLTIEHVLPQEWHEHWPLNTNEHPEVATFTRNRVKHTLGNLTLINGKLNPSISNSAWERKRQEIEKHSLLRLNYDLLHHASDVWDENTIWARGRRLADVVIRIWPGRASPEWAAIKIELPLGRPAVFEEPLDVPEKSKRANVREMISRMSKSDIQLVGEALLDELLSWPECYVRIQSSTTADKQPRRVLFHRKGSPFGAFLHMYPKWDNITVIFRLPKYMSEGRDVVEARDVKSSDPYQLRAKLRSMDVIPKALELAQAAYDDTSE
jgi:Protein of unknown function DUF262/Protein of unknown function (DUF1524)